MSEFEWETNQLTRECTKNEFMSSFDNKRGLRAPLRAFVADYYRTGSTLPTNKNLLVGRSSTAKSLHMAYDRLTRDSFEIQQTLGEGSYGAVYAAVIKSVGVPCALKVLNKSHLVRNKAVHTVMREKDALTRAGISPFIITLLGCFQDSESLYFALEKAEMGDVAEAVTCTGPLEVAAARWFAAQALAGLRALFAARVLHRDFKPENLLIMSDGTLRITDFGTAKIDATIEYLAPTPEQLATEARIDAEAEAAERAAVEAGDLDAIKAAQARRVKRDSFVGTACYVAPELLSARRVSAASDLWGLGCTIYYMLAGKPPFHGGSEVAVFDQIQSGEYALGGRVIPTAAHTIIQQLLSQDPAQREPAGTRLEDHPFFAGIDWENLATAQPPAAVVNLLSKLKSARESDQKQGPGLGILDEASVRLAPFLLKNNTCNEKFLHIAEVASLRMFRRPKLYELCLTDFPRVFMVPLGARPIGTVNRSKLPSYIRDDSDDDAPGTTNAYDLRGGACSSPLHVSEIKVENGASFIVRDENTNEPIEVTEVPVTHPLKIEMEPDSQIFRLISPSGTFKFEARRGGATLWKAVLEKAYNKHKK